LCEKTGPPGRFSGKETQAAQGKILGIWEVTRCGSSRRNICTIIKKEKRMSPSLSRKFNMSWEQNRI
jgi:hypothetical protein